LYTDVDVVCDVDAVTLQMNTVNVYIKVVTTLRCERVSIHLWIDAVSVMLILWSQSSHQSPVSIVAT